MTSHPVRPQNLSALRSTMTALSRRHASEPHPFADLTSMARVSLVVWGVMAFGSSGCLITDAPSFGAPVKTRPILANLQPRPEVAHEIPFQPGSDRSALLYAPGPRISFDVISEDLGDDLEVLVILDFEGFDSLVNPRALCNTTIDPGTLNSEARPFNCPTDVNLKFPNLRPGCYTFTAVVSHRLHLFTANPVTPGDVATATWFYQVGDTGKDPPDEKYWPCKPVPTPADAGADVRADRGGF